MPNGFAKIYNNLKSLDNRRDSLKPLMDKAIYFGGFFGPILTIPQLTKIWVYRNASGVSIISWSAYLVEAAFWFFYGYVNKHKPMMLAYALWILLDIFIIIGVGLYG